MTTLPVETRFKDEGFAPPKAFTTVARAGARRIA
jgi:hypothetical protein